MLDVYVVRVLFCIQLWQVAADMGERGGSRDQGGLELGHYVQLADSKANKKVKSSFYQKSIY